MNSRCRVSFNGGGVSSNSSGTVGDSISWNSCFALTADVWFFSLELKTVLPWFAIDSPFNGPCFVASPSSADFDFSTPPGEELKSCFLVLHSFLLRVLLSRTSLVLLSRTGSVEPVLLSRASSEFRFQKYF